MTTKRLQNDVSVWRFRREVTFAAVVHLVVLLGMVMAGWANLQKELALIRQELTRLNTDSARLQQDVSVLSTARAEHDYRLKTLENKFRH